MSARPSAPKTASPARTASPRGPKAGNAAPKAAGAASVATISKAKSSAKTAPVAKASPARKAGPAWHRRAAERPEDLVGAAWKIFRSKGFRATRLEDVAREAGVATTLIYHYFENKEDLLYAAFVAQVALFRADLEAKLATFRGDSSSALRLTLTAHWERWKNPDWGCLQRLLAGELANNPAFARRWSGSAKPYRGKIIEDIIRQGQAAGEFDASLDASEAREFIFSALVQQAMHHLHPAPGATAAKRRPLDMVVELALRCLRPTLAAKPAAPATRRPAGPRPRNKT